MLDMLPGILRREIGRHEDFDTRKGPTSGRPFYRGALVLWYDYSLMIPRWSAAVTASVRWLTSSFWKMLATCVLTVLSLMDRDAAISLLAAPLAILAFGGSVVQTVPQNLPAMGIAGLLVGVGTALGSGCTSGHGVCGLARLSGRSLAAVVTFMAAGFVTVFVIRHVMGGL